MGQAMAAPCAAGAPYAAGAPRAAGAPGPRSPHSTLATACALAGSLTVTLAGNVNRMWFSGKASVRVTVRLSSVAVAVHRPPPPGDRWLAAPGGPGRWPGAGAAPPQAASAIDAAARTGARTGRGTW